MQNHQRSGLLLNQGILGHQIWGNFARNQWVNWPTNGTPHSEVWGNNTNGSLTKFFVPTTAAAEYQPTNNYVDPIANPNSIAMSQPVNTSTYLAENYVCANPELYDDIEEMCDNVGLMLIHLINDTATLVNAFDSTARWENKYQIYKLLKSDTIKYYLSDTTLTAFVNLHDTTEIGLLHKSEIAVATMWNKKGSELDDEIADLSSLSPSCVASQTMKTVLLTALTLYAEDRKPDSTETSELEILAAQCPYEYGSGVHSTRALLSRYDTTFVNRLNPCEIPVEPEFRKSDNDIPSGNEPAASIGLFPNPTTGVMQLNIGEAMNGMLSVSDISGRIVHFQERNWEVSNNLNLSHLNNGIYLFDFKSQLITKKWKIVVSK